MTSSGQLRAGRGLVGLSQADIAMSTGLSIPTIKRAEGDGRIKVSDEAVAAIQGALEKAGIIFVEENGEGPGVRLRKTRKPVPERVKEAADRAEAKPVKPKR